jgi:hypothetical protein
MAQVLTHRPQKEAQKKEAQNTADSKQSKRI